MLIHGMHNIRLRHNNSVLYYINYYVNGFELYAFLILATIEMKLDYFIVMV